MGKIVQCDFRRTMRRQRLDEIMTEIYEMADNQNLDLSNRIDEEKLFNQAKAIQLQNEYADLILEEQAWSDCKYYK